MATKLENFKPYGATKFLTPTTTSQRDQLPDVSAGYVAAPDAYVYNETDQTAYIEFGDITVNAVKPTGNTSCSIPVPKGAAVVFSLEGKKWWAVVVDSAIASGRVYVTPGSGN